MTVKTLTKQNEDILVSSMQKMAEMLQTCEEMTPTDALYILSKEASLKPPMIELLAQSYNVGSSIAQHDEPTLLGKLANFELADSRKVIDLIYNQTPEQIKQAEAWDEVSSDWSGKVQPVYQLDDVKAIPYYLNKGYTSKIASDLPKADFGKERERITSMVKHAEVTLHDAADEVIHSFVKIARYLNLKNRLSNEELEFGVSQLFGKTACVYLEQAAEAAPSFKRTGRLPLRDIPLSADIEPFCYIKEAVYAKATFETAEKTLELLKKKQASTSPTLGTFDYAIQDRELKKSRNRIRDVYTDKEWAAEAERLKNEILAKHRTILADFKQQHPNQANDIQKLKQLDDAKDQEIALFQKKRDKERAEAIEKQRLLDFQKEDIGDKLHDLRLRGMYQAVSGGAKLVGRALNEGLNRPINNAAHGMNSGLNFAINAVKDFTADNYSNNFDPSSVTYHPKADTILKMRNYRVMSTLSDLMANDPVIKGYDPTIVLQAANELTNSMPNLMASPILMKAALREILAKGGTWGMFDVDAASKLDQAARVGKLDKRDFLQKKV